MNYVLWKPGETAWSCICCIFGVSFKATVAGNGCDDKEDAELRAKGLLFQKLHVEFCH